MEQINFRISPDEKAIIKLISDTRGISMAEFAKQSVLNEISKERVDLAFKLLKEGVIGRKRTWIISGLSNLQFLNEWTIRGAEECITDEILDKEWELARYIDLKKYLINS